MGLSVKISAQDCRPPDMTERLRVGDLLYSTCSAYIYGKIVAVRETQVDLIVYHSETLRPESDTGMLPAPNIPTAVDHVEIVKIDDDWCPDRRGKVESADDPMTGKRLLDVGFGTGRYVHLDTPGDDCYRCSKGFHIIRPADSQL